MKINLVNRRNNPELEDFVTSRLERTAERFSDRISHVDVRFADENGAKGGADKTCSIDLRLIGRGDIHVSAHGDNIYTVASNAIHRAEAALTKTIERGNRSRQIRHRGGGVSALSQDLVTPE
jgi:ribosomal subunit interface protein